jgi:ubiquinone/menaquinone biosynthesis C-methylase UbiE
MDEKNRQLQRNWRERQEVLGSTKRSVLYKNFPDILNSSLHKRHVRFILSQLPEQPNNILDLGCGYGRISAEIKKTHPDSKIEGVELCDEFAEQFRMTIGECVSAAMQDYEPTRMYDVVLCITVLMYLAQDELQQQLSRYWQAIRPGGRLICIESFNNSLIGLRKASDSKSMSPTGGELVHYFQPGELASAIMALPNARIVRRKKFGIIPLLAVPRLHEGYAVEKLANP